MDGWMDGWMAPPSPVFAHQTLLNRAHTTHTQTHATKKNTTGPQSVSSSPKPSQLPYPQPATHTHFNPPNSPSPHNSQSLHNSQSPHHSPFPISTQAPPARWPSSTCTRPWTATSSQVYTHTHASLSHASLCVSYRCGEKDAGWCVSGHFYVFCTPPPPSSFFSPFPPSTHPPPISPINPNPPP
jgi:hypothetical protein